MKQLAYTRPWLADYQTEAFFTPKRYSLIEATTKAGKTAGALVWLFERAAIHGKEGQMRWWVAPVYSQAEIAYERFVRGLPRSICTPHNTKLLAVLANGAQVQFKSAEKANNLYGDDVWDAVMDEASRTDDDAFHAVRSTLTATQGNLRVVGNVHGRKNWFYKMARVAERGHAEMHYAKITCHDAVKAGIITQKEIDDAQDMLPAHVFRELYEAEASGGEGRVYPAFGKENVREDVKDSGGTILVGMDFNVDPMSACMSSRVVDELHTWGEITFTNGNTEMMCQEIRRRWPSREIIVYPDPSGKSRRSSAVAGQTDFTIIRSYGMKLYAPNKAPLIVDRVNCVNALIQNAAGRRRWFIHPRCKTVIAGLEDQMYKEDTKIPDKAGGLDHMNDASGYKISAEFPINDMRTVGFASLGGF